MSFLSRLLGTAPDPRERLRRLWHAIVGKSRNPAWYTHGEMEDTVDGRFDMIVAILSLVMLRMERSEQLAPDTALLTELFVEDMDRQLRDSGVGDLMVGKKMGVLMAALGGQLGALRKALASADDTLLREALARNMRVGGDGSAAGLAPLVRSFAKELDTLSDEQIAQGTIAA